MNDFYGYEDLAFFGQVNASISHELKNIMAIISETAGLLGDLTDLSSTGKPIELDALKMCTSTITEEIQRGFFTIRQMNRFAHSVDHPIEQIDLTEVVDLIAKLSGFLSYAGRVQVKCDETEKAMIHSAPFLVQTLLYQSLKDIYGHTGPKAEVTITIRSNGDAGWKIIYSGFDSTESERFPQDAVQRTADRIGVGIDHQPGAGRLEFLLPHTIEEVGDEAAE